MSLFPVHSWGETMDDLVERGGIYSKKFTGEPFTGEVKQLWDKGEWRSGERVGPWITYFNDGQLYFQGEYRNGSPEGPWMTYYQDGRLNAKGNYKNGKREGSWVSYLIDGTVNKGMTGMFKNGEKISD